MTPVEVIRGDSPVVLGLPHTGTFVPQDIWESLTPLGQELRDTDWHIDQLYADLLPNATTVRATFHRYVIDANRDPSGQSLYPGQNTTGLVPFTDFDGNDLWRSTPSTAQMKQRLKTYHQPYHEALRAELDRVKALHGVAILYDCHSIRSYIPYLFDGRLPDFNVGTNNGTTCGPMITDMVVARCRAASGYSTVLDGRFKGGWTTRHYGQPNDGVHAIQMELAQSTYLASEEPPFAYDSTRADVLRGHLRDILHAVETFPNEMKGAK